ncbi:hypothetical protein JMG10_04930 [Nostoc ellipsosporum NOK]|nr:hypothetical protein [Nostoc ellipsosporum NOK]
MQGFREIRLRELQQKLGDSNPAVARFMDELAAQARHCRKEIASLLKASTRPAFAILDQQCWRPMFRMRDVLFNKKNVNPVQEEIAEINETTGSIYRRILDQATPLPRVISTLLSQQHSDLMKAVYHFPAEPESRH